MQRFVLTAALAAGCLVLPAAASAAVKQIVVNEDSGSYCVSVDNGPTAVTFTVRAPGGGVLRTKQVSTATASQNCGGAATPGAESFTTTVENSPGATVTADAGSGVSATFPIPYAAYDASGPTGIFKVKNMPSASGVVTINAVPFAYAGPAYTTPAAVTIGTAQVDIASSIGSISYSVLLHAPRYTISSSYYGNVSANGSDPLGAPIAVSVMAGAALQQSTAMTPSVDAGQYEQTSLPLRVPSGAAVTVTQPGWFSHTVTHGSIAASTSSIGMSVPALAGETATASFDLTYQATSSLPPSDPLSCRAFGDATYMLAQCGSSGARFAATFPVFFTANESVQLAVNEVDGDQAGTQVRAGGFQTYMGDGSLSATGLVPNSQLTLTATTPAHVTASTSAVTYDDGAAYVSSGEGSREIPLRIVSGTTIVASGPATGGAPRSYVANLEAQGLGSVVSGTTYPGARIAISNSRPTGSTLPVYGTADASGAFALDVGPVLPRDYISVYAADPSGTMSSVRVLLPGSPQPLIQGLVDQQLVHGTVSASALGGGPSGIFWRGDGPGALAVTAPFDYSLDTTLLSDGPHRVDAYAAGLYNGLTDYLYLRVDNTLPAVSAGPDQYVAIGHPAVLLPTARDANGIASLSVSFGDQTTTSQPVAQIGMPIRHVYARSGTFTETVTATDAAGNVSSSTAVIHVISKLSEQVAGKIPASFKQAKKLKKRKNLSIRFTSHMAGELGVRVLNASGKQKASLMLSFAAADARATLTLPTRKWPKGRYTVVLQFIDAAGSPGPVVLSPLRIK